MQKVFLEEAATAKSSMADCAKDIRLGTILNFPRSRVANVMCVCVSAL